MNADGAEAVSAIKGAPVSALRLPMLRNASRKLGPLKQDKLSVLIHELLNRYVHLIILTIHIYSGPHPLTPGLNAVSLQSL